MLEVALEAARAAARIQRERFGSHLEVKFKSAVDLVTEKALRSELRPYIEQERVNV